MEKPTIREATGSGAVSVMAMLRQQLLTLWILALTTHQGAALLSD